MELCHPLSCPDPNRAVPQVLRSDALRPVLGAYVADDDFTLAESNPGVTTLGTFGTFGTLGTLGSTAVREMSEATLDFAKMVSRQPPTLSPTLLAIGMTRARSVSL